MGFRNLQEKLENKIWCFIRRNKCHQIFFWSEYCSHYRRNWWSSVFLTWNDKEFWQKKTQLKTDCFKNVKIMVWFIEKITNIRCFFGQNSAHITEEISGHLLFLTKNVKKCNLHFNFSDRKNSWTPISSIMWSEFCSHCQRIWLFLQLFWQKNPAEHRFF